ncbi:unnamed protein product, partial [Hymenolepis diminuta]
MYTPNKEHIRHILLFEFHQGNMARDTHGDDVANEKACKRWFSPSRFKKDEFRLKDEPRAGYS